MTTQTPAEPEPTATGLSRRGLFGLAGAGVAGAALGGASAAAVMSGGGAANSAGVITTYPFFGDHQAGITTAAQDRLHFAAFDLSETTSRDELIELLKDWSFAAARMTQGQDVTEAGAVNGSPLAPPDDTGEALDLPASALTITFGFGPTLFTTDDGVDRFGIASQKPALLAKLPRFSGDALIPGAGGGDLCIQACADDPQVAVHAIRNLSRIAFGRASIRWSQLGFGRTSSTSTSQVTPRNLFGFKDGTANIKAEDPTTVNDQVWVGNDDAAWLTGGSYLVTRKIRMIIEAWDRTMLGEQERVIGRNKGEGAPLSGGSEFSELDFESKGAADQPLIDTDAHVRLAHSSVTKGSQLLRRGYNYVDGNDELGRLDAGLFFISFQRSPQQFIDVQSNLSRDALNEYIKHVGSAIFAVPPGAASGSYVGASLFG
ncbi:iron uptake transporter deferrochelatase/peroxidase subunit [Salinibacterium sp. G-O1]|uniref:iron uptake transporter deferrochelatase/peroxidase subunit n=1 Tax=Salinibacterium sp. G-O1 TaxID=3046208 RepID=UPI0024B9F8EC|nr:iron uptake transporter deferrochelatase/peroxidase subunit [Salinibacterium sp. G-O1]MDJ0334484.1 iron uptake transporter deferrochelatase/peroxidase subunit [Salinibacterium sp. G-O1]